MSKAPMNYTEEDVERGSDAKDWQEAIDSAVQSLRQHNLDEWELHLIARRVKAALSSIPRQNGQEWMPIETAPKDGTRVLLQLRSPIPESRADLRRWDGIPFVGRHHGDDISGWQFAAPVGHGGFPDEWMAGWQPLPAPPAPKEER